MVREALCAGRFPEFFSAVHGHGPFPWQKRLAERVLAEGWPEALDVPTGLGKTSVLDVAVFSLAAQAHLAPSDRSAPTRTFFVVDRRLVVDDVTRHAERLYCGLHHRTTIPILAEVAERLRHLFGGSPDDAPLAIARWRGGLARDRASALRPDVPALVVSTVDQFGSRLLFRGYGLSEGQRPIQAALAGTDELLVLD